MMSFTVSSAVSPSSSSMARPRPRPLSFSCISKPKIYAFSTNDIQVEFLHVNPGKGAAFVRTKIRNYVVEKTFPPGTKHQMRSQQHHRPYLVSRSATVVATNNKSKVQALVERVRALSESNDKRIQIPNTWSLSEFNRLLSTLLAAAHPALALDFFSNISALGLLPDSRTFSIVISCHCHSGDLGEAKKVLYRMAEEPDVATITDLIHAFCRKGQLQNAFEVFEFMGRIGCQPTVVTYNCLIKGLCYVGKVEEATEMLAHLKKRSLTVKPDIYTYTAVMDGLCKVGRSDEAMELLAEAVEMELTPTVVTFSTLFTGYSREGRPLEGLQLLRQMKESNCSPDYIAYTTLLHGLLRWGQFQAAVGVYWEMAEAGFEADPRMMNKLLKGLCRGAIGANAKEERVFKDAYQVFVKMMTRDANTINTATYSIVVQMLCIRNKTLEAFYHLREMVEGGYTPRRIAFNHVIKAMCSQGKADKALIVLVLMHGCHCQRAPSNYTYDLLMAEFNRQGLFVGASTIFGAALKRGVIPRQKPQR